MTQSDTPPDHLNTTAVIIPALNEAPNLLQLLPQLAPLNLGQVIVADNGSTDDTPTIARQHRATLVTEPRRGYGAACYAGMEHLNPNIDIIAFLDADLSDDPAGLPQLVRPIRDDEKDLVLGARLPHLRQPGSMTFTQRFGTGLAVKLVRLGWGFRFADMGPFRAVRRTALEAIGMKDRAYGWTLEMQIRAVELGLRISEIPVPYRCRPGQTKSKISGTLTGSLKAGYWILSTCARYWWTKNSRTSQRSPAQRNN
ncbi:MAG: glycosyltransferase family 2 protein [Phycisphaerae bacterium]